MRSENAMMPSRREFLSDALGIGLVTASNWSIRDRDARSMDGQSDGGAANSGRTTGNTSLTWQVFLALEHRASPLKRHLSVPFSAAVAHVDATGRDVRLRHRLAH